MQHSMSIYCYTIVTVSKSSKREQTTGVKYPQSGNDRFSNYEANPQATVNRFCIRDLLQDLVSPLHSILVFARCCPVSWPSASILQ